MVIVPLLLPTLTVITTTMIIVALKTFDIVYVLTGGAYDTDVIASQMFTQLASAGTTARVRGRRHPADRHHPAACDQRAPLPA
jgi:ABC-type sugar transport system permease subunit